MFNEIPDKEKTVATPEKVKAVETKAKPIQPVSWRLAKGIAVNIPGLFEVTNANLNNPPVIASITMYEARTGRQLFGTVFVKK